MIVVTLFWPRDKLYLSNIGAQERSYVVVQWLAQLHNVQEA